MNSWVFKAKPHGEYAYDYSEKLRVGQEEKWNSAEARDPMRVGDRVFFWATTPLLHVAGLGVVTQIHSQGGISVRYLTNILSEPPTIAELKAHPALEKAKFLKSGVYGTVFDLTPKEAKALYGLVVMKNPNADVWPEVRKAQAGGNAVDSLLFEVGAKFNDGLVSLAEAQAQLLKLGINRGSATNYLYNTRHLLAGRCYKRHMTIGPTTAFLAWIKEHRSPAEYQNSLRSLEAHLQYRESSGIRHPRHRELLARLRGERNSDTNWLGHRNDSGAARLDDLLKRGATMDELKQVRGGVHEHIRHLREKWGIQCEEKDGKWRMVGTDKSAQDDLPEDPPTGCDDPQKNTRTVTTYTRDPAVRAYVLHEAKGRCEYCGELGFLKPNGERYLEAHHLLALSEDGPDTPQNVVALCATHHREAHYGRERAKLEAAVVAKRKGALSASLGI